MSVIEKVSDVDNTFLSRRELVCDFVGLGGRIDRLEAIDMVTKKFELAGKIIIPMRMKNQVGRSTMTGTFFVYDDEKLARAHVNPAIFTRLEKARAARTDPKETTEAG